MIGEEKTIAHGMGLIEKMGNGFVHSLDSFGLWRLGGCPVCDDAMHDTFTEIEKGVLRCQSCRSKFRVKLEKAD